VVVKYFSLLRCLICIHVVFVILVSASYAKELDGVSMPDTTSLGGKELVLNGMGTRKATIFSVKVYVMGLYLEKRAGDADAIINSDGTKMIIMHFVRDVGMDKLVEGWQEGFEKNYPGIASIQKEIGAFKKSMRDIENGKSIILLFTDDIVTVRFDDEIRTSIQGKSFQQALLSVWLGPAPPNADLKKGILGQ
jgi:hypothetical protein